MLFTNEILDLIAGIVIISVVFINLCYLVAIIIKNFALVDFGWSFNFFLINLYIFLYFDFKDLNVKSLILIFGMIWSLRLAIYLFIARIYGKEEEGRYKTLREFWKNNLYFNFFLFFNFQAITNIVLSIPFIMIVYQSHFFYWNHILSIMIFIIAFTGETIADSHLYWFKSQPQNRNKVLNRGLWKYSRHPNYFFEILIWFSYSAYHLNLSNWYIALIPFLIISYFIFRVTGIPATEKQNLLSKGEEYKNYIENTSPILPLPNKVYIKYFK